MNPPSKCTVMSASLGFHFNRYKMFGIAILFWTLKLFCSISTTLCKFISLYVAIFRSPPTSMHFFVILATIGRDLFLFFVLEANSPRKESR